VLVNNNCHLISQDLTVAILNNHHWCYFFVVSLYIWPPPPPTGRSLICWYMYLVLYLMCLIHDCYILTYQGIESRIEAFFTNMSNASLVLSLLYLNVAGYPDSAVVRTLCCEPSGYGVESDSYLHLQYWSPLSYYHSCDQHPENLENNKFIFLVLEMSLNFTKSRNVVENILPVRKST